MTIIASNHRADEGDCNQRHTAFGYGGLGWLSRALMIFLSCVVVQCSSDTTGPRSSGSSGGSSVNTAGTTAVGGTEMGGAYSAGGITSAPIGGTSTTTTTMGSGGSLATSNPATSGGVAPTGGTSSVASTGGLANSGGANSTGGRASTGGANITGGAAGGAAGNAGKSGTGGAPATGGTNGVGGKAGTGGAPTSGGTTSAAGKSSIGGVSGLASGGATSSGTFTLTSPGWTNQDGCGPTNKAACAPLPTEITRFGAGTSPELQWTGAPAGTKSFVVLLQDLNNGTAHWVLWNIQPTNTTLAANIDQTTATPAVPAGSQQCGKGTDAATTNGYYGPGASCNVYEFVVYALSISTFSPTSPTDQESVRTQLQALGSSILGTASLRGRTNQSC